MVVKAVVAFAAGFAGLARLALFTGLTRLARCLGFVSALCSWAAWVVTRRALARAVVALAAAAVLAVLLCAFTTRCVMAAVAGLKRRCLCVVARCKTLAGRAAWATTARTLTICIRCRGCITTGRALRATAAIRLSSLGGADAIHHFLASCTCCGLHDITAWWLARATPDGLATHGDGLSLFTGLRTKFRHWNDGDLLLGKAFNIHHEAFFVHAN